MNDVNRDVALLWRAAVRAIADGDLDDAQRLTEAAFRLHERDCRRDHHDDDRP